MTRAVALQDTITRRVALSGPLIERMGVAPEVFERTLLNAIVSQPDLAECDPRSVERAIIQAVGAGLMPDGREAAIIPFRDRKAGTVVATLIPMIEGQIKLARRATPGLVLRTRVVFEGDEWEHSEGLAPTIRHVPAESADRRNERIRAAYAVAIVPGAASPEWEVMYRETIERYRARGADRGPWRTDWGEMARKTVLRQLLKRLPRTPDAPPAPPEALAHYEVEEIAPALDVLGEAEHTLLEEPEQVAERVPEPAAEPAHLVEEPPPPDDAAEQMEAPF